MIAILGIAVVMLADAAGPQTQGFVAGPGTETCAQFGDADTNDTSSEFEYFFWAQGWLTGLNSAEATKCWVNRTEWDLRSAPTDEQMLSIRQFCDEHPQAPYTEAVVYMRNKLLKKMPLGFSSDKTCK